MAGKKRVKMRWWIKKRISRFVDPYWEACGRMSEEKAGSMRGCIAGGENTMHPYKTERDYKARLVELRKAGEFILS
jgi:hypothetical protein